MRGAMHITRDQLLALAPRLIKPAGACKPAVYEVEAEGVACILKDARATPRLLRPIARRLMRRERRLLERLADVAAVPRVLAAPDADCLLLSRMPGAPMRAGNTPGGVRAIVDRLLGILGELHARGVYHLDLRHKRNLVIAADGNVALVDFGAALALGPFARRLFGGALARMNRRAALKYLGRWAPADLTASELTELNRFGALRRFWIFAPQRPPAGERERLHAAAEEQA